jgi:hypothetical protein
MKKIFLNLDKLPNEIRTRLVDEYPDAIELNISGKERSELTESRIRSAMQLSKPVSSDHDFLFCGTKIELKQAEAYMKGPKFQQIKPSCYSHIICMLNYRDKSEWYLLETSKISKKAGASNVESGKLPLNAQHRYNTAEGQISPNKAFKKASHFLGQYRPLLYYREDLNLPDETIVDIFGKIERILSL